MNASKGLNVWNLVTSSLDRNLINLRCACGTCAETKKNVLDCTREPPCWNLDSLCTRCVLLSVAVPFCSVTVRSLWLSIRRLKSINSVLWFTQNAWRTQNVWTLEVATTVLVPADIPAMENTFVKARTKTINLDLVSKLVCDQTSDL